MTPLLSIRELDVALRADPAKRVVRGLSFDVAKGEVLGLVGESGCGKSVTSLAIMGLLPDGLTVAGGSIAFDGAPLVPARMRGRRIGMVFQDPMTALNPVLTIGSQITEVVRAHLGLGRAAARTRALELLAQVRLPDPHRVIDTYPARLSGGQRQRVVIAIAIACNPALVIADEPTTALDPTIQAQVMALLATLRDELGIALVLITHNLGLVAQAADRVLVMYAGRKVEEATTEAIFARPLHPYTRRLLAATPRPGTGARLTEIPGLVPSVLDLPPGCAFAPRCDMAEPACLLQEPELTAPEPGRLAACLRA